MADADAQDQLAGYDVIVMANVSCLSDTEAAVLDAFVERGGTIVATGETGHYDERGRRRAGFALSSFPATRAVHTAAGLETYVAIGTDELDFPQTRLLHLDGWYFHTEAKADAEGLLNLMPVQDYGPPELCFPDLMDSGNPGVLIGSSGKGRVAYLPWLPEWLYFRDGLSEHRSLILQLIAHGSQVPVKLAGAGPIEVTLRGKGADEIVVHLVNYAGQRGSAYEDPPALGGLRLGVKGLISGGRALVADTALTSGEPDAEGYSWIDVPAVKHFEVLVLKAASGA